MVRGFVFQVLQLHALEGFMQHWGMSDSSSFVFCAVSCWHLLGVFGQVHYNL
jgi:hypothetical protein